MHALWALQCPCNVPMPHAKLSGGAKSHVHPNLLGRPPGASLRRTGMIHGTQFETEAIQM